MSDILRVTTPLVNKSQAIPAKAGIEPMTPFNIQDTTRVIRTHNQSELMQQNNGMIDNGDAPAMLLNLLKDPAVAVSYLKNIFLLEEIFKLLPVNNKTITQEIQQIFSALILQPGEIKQELVRQEHASTMFKGAFFDFLRAMSDTYKGSPEVQFSIATLLKSINNLASQKNITDAVANSLAFLKSNLGGSKELSAKLEELLQQFRREDSVFQFQGLKEQTLEILKEVEGSILFSPKLSKVISIVMYNLSRYNNNMDFFHESAFRLRQLLNGDHKNQFLQLLEDFTKGLKAGSLAQMQNLPLELGQNSQVMEALVQLISQQAESDNVSPMDAAKIDKILYSLLSSPCNFTPLLHFIVPVMYENIRAFAEFWINPDSDEKDMGNGAKSGKHFLMVIDVEQIGRFEAELFVYDNTIDFHLFCPPGYTEKYEPMMERLPKVLSGMAYRVGETRLETLERSRSLMDVFKSLPYKRVGVDVKI